MGWGGEPDRAIDRSSSSDYNAASCTHTDAGTDASYGQVDQQLHGAAWWQVDMGGLATVDKVNIWHRTDCCQVDRETPAPRAARGAFRRPG